MAQFRDLCSTEDVPEGQSRMFVIDETTICVVRLGNEYFAMNNTCPHAGASLAHGYMENDVIHCRIHHWRFCVKSGKYLDEDKPAMNVKTYPIQLVGDQLQIRL